jgi:hypothetical protein
MTDNILLKAQRDHRIDPSRPPGGDICGNDGDGDQQNRDNDKGDDVRGADPEEQRLQHARGGKRCPDAPDRPQTGQHHGMPQHHAQDVDTSCAEGDSNADLTRDS